MLVCVHKKLYSTNDSAHAVAQDSSFLCARRCSGRRYQYRRSGVKYRSIRLCRKIEKCETDDYDAGTPQQGPVDAVEKCIAKTTGPRGWRE